MSLIIFIGDSIVKGTDYGGVTAVNTFAQKIGAANGYTHIINAGVSSDTSAGVLARLQADVVVKMPSVCVLMVGANDVEQQVPLDVYRMNLQNIFSILKLNKIKTIAMTSNLVRGDGASFAKFLPYLKVFEDEAAFQNAPIVDLYREIGMSYFYNNSGFSALYVDTVHLTVAGHQFVTDLAARKQHARHFLPCE